MYIVDGIQIILYNIGRRKKKNWVVSITIRFVKFKISDKIDEFESRGHSQPRQNLINCCRSFEPQIRVFGRWKHAARIQTAYFCTSIG